MKEDTAQTLTDSIKSEVDSVEGLVWAGGGGNVLSVSFVHQGRLDQDTRSALQQIAEDNGVAFNYHDTYHEEVVRVTLSDTVNQQ